jgi:hypothetical protein
VVIGLSLGPAGRAQDAAPEPVEEPATAPTATPAADPDLEALAAFYYDRMLPMTASEFARTAVVLNHETRLIAMPTDLVTSLTPVQITPPRGAGAAEYLFTTRHTPTLPPMLCGAIPTLAADAFIEDLRDSPKSEGVQDGDTAYLLSMERAADGTRRGHREAVTVTKLRHLYPQLRRDVIVFNTARQDRHIGGVLMAARSACWSGAAWPRRRCWSGSYWRCGPAQPPGPRSYWLGWPVRSTRRSTRSAGRCCPGSRRGTCTPGTPWTRSRSS